MGKRGVIGRERERELKSVEIRKRGEREGMCNRKKEEERRDRRKGKGCLSSPTKSIQIHPHVAPSISRYG